MPYEIVERRMVAPNVHRLTVRAPEVATSVLPGQFVMVRAIDSGERIPLTPADWDPEAGTVTCYFIEVGESTSKLALRRAGDTLPTFAGPLGVPTEIEDYGTVLLVGGCYGLGSLVPLARALKAAGNRVVVLLEARSSFLIYGEDRYKGVADKLIIVTRDGTRGHQGHISRLPEILRRERIDDVDRVIVNGCTFLLRRTSETTRPLGYKTIVSMNPIMIDGTGMCGVCRLTVGGKTKFACVDGPDFDGHEVDWDEFFARRTTYSEEEVEPLRQSDSGTAHHLGYERGCGGGA